MLKVNFPKCIKCDRSYIPHPLINALCFVNFTSKVLFDIVHQVKRTWTPRARTFLMLSLPWGEQYLMVSHIVFKYNGNRGKLAIGFFPRPWSCTILPCVVIPGPPFIFVEHTCCCRSQIGILSTHKIDHKRHIAICCRYINL